MRSPFRADSSPFALHLFRLSMWGIGGVEEFAEGFVGVAEAGGGAVAGGAGAVKELGEVEAGGVAETGFGGDGGVGVGVV